MPIAADESIRRAADPMRVVELEAADIAVLKVAPLGGVHACLRIAEQIGLPVVVSSAVETSIGLAAGLALAAALPELPYACGLATTSLLDGESWRRRSCRSTGFCRWVGNRSIPTRTRLSPQMRRPTRAGRSDLPKCGRSCDEPQPRRSRHWSMS